MLDSFVTVISSRRKEGPAPPPIVFGTFFPQGDCSPLSAHPNESEKFKKEALLGAEGTVFQDLLPFLGAWSREALPFFPWD